MRKVITPVGTSLFENYREKNALEYYDEIKDCFHKDWENYKREIERIQDPLLKWARSSENSSAEIKSIMKIKDEVKDELDIYLLASDTIVSRLAAEIITEIMKERFDGKSGLTVKFEPGYVVKSLQIRNRKEFAQEGLSNFINIIEKISGEYFDNLIFNITGGYKVLLPYMTIISQVFKVPSYYIFEDTDELIKIPRSPIDIDWAFISDNYNLLKELSCGVTDKTLDQYKKEKGIKNANVENLIEDLIWYDENDKLLELNAVGKMFLKQFQSWSIVFALSNGPFTNSDSHKNHLNKAIQDLRDKLKQFIKNNNLQKKSLSDIYKAVSDSKDPLAHKSIKGECFVYKYPANEPEIRILYGFKATNGEINELKIFDYRCCGFKHENYIKEFEALYDQNKNGKFAAYLQLKNRG